MKNQLFSWKQSYTFSVWCFFILFSSKYCLGIENYTIYRHVEDYGDRFKMPASICGTQGKCDLFYASKTQKACECMCDLNDGKRSTLALNNGTWSCSYDKELRSREGCTMLFISESLDSPMTVVAPSAAQSYMVSRWTEFHCTINKRSAKYQNCDGKWIPIRNPDQMFDYYYVWLRFLTDSSANSFAYLHGKIIKLEFDCTYWSSGRMIRDCLLFKFSGNVSCPVPTKRRLTVQSTTVSSVLVRSTSSYFSTVAMTLSSVVTITVSTSHSMMRSSVAGVQSSTMMISSVAGIQSSSITISSKQVVETKVIEPSPTIQASVNVSFSALPTVITGNKDRRLSASTADPIFTVIGGIAAAVLVVIAMITAVIIIQRKRKLQQEGNTNRNTKSPLHLSKTFGKSNESLTSFQGGSSSMDVILEQGNSEYQLKQEEKSQKENQEIEEENVKNKEMKTKSNTQEQNSPSSCYETLRSFQSYESLAHTNDILFSDDYAYARCDGFTIKNDDEPKSPIYYVLEGPDPNSSSGTNTQSLRKHKNSDNVHVYESADGFEVHFFDDVYSTIDETEMTRLGTMSPQSPIYLDLEPPMHEEVEI